MFAGRAPAVDPDELFDRVYGLGRFLPLWLRYQAEAYRSATTMMRDFHEPEATDLHGHVRRARCEEALATTAKEIGLQCVVRTNSRRSYSHRVVATDRFLLVQCHHPNAREIVRSAEHREIYASPGQGDLFRDVGAPHLPAGKKVFGILQHGPHPKAKGTVGYSYINFPNADVDRYRSSFDLLDRYGDYPVAPETRTPGMLIIQPRRRRKGDTA